MATVTVGKENSTPVNLYYEDHGSGSPVVLIHGWPLSGASWEKQTAALLAAGHRVITYDRRGFGRSSKPAVGYYDVTGGTLVSERVLEENWNVAVGASAVGTVACVDCWIEDFRKNIAKNNVPTLILHGDADRILPPDATSRRQAKLVKNVKFVELPGGPHGVLWTHADKINSELVRFLS
jgi:pimeloyl-ACP methyl ester carboxylesterase